MKLLLFFIVIMLTNIVQGITGFAGTILAMIPSIMLVGYDTAKPVLNMLGLLAGIWIFLSRYKYVSWKELLKIIVFMTCGMFISFFIKPFFKGKEQILYLALGIFVIYLGAKGLYTLLKKEKTGQSEKKDIPLLDDSVLGLAGIVHGIFVCGGPLLIGYLSKRIKDKVSFRATISTVWVILNSIILSDDIRNGLWNIELVKVQLISLPFFIIGMYIGGRLYSKMSQKFFMGLTYVLLLISGVSLFIK